MKNKTLFRCLPDDSWDMRILSDNLIMVFV